VKEDALWQSGSSGGWNGGRENVRLMPGAGDCRGAFERIGPNAAGTNIGVLEGEKRDAHVMGEP
jgi:hypothetical protein